MKRAAVTAIEHYLPPTRISNDFLAVRYAITSESIYEKTGIKNRFYLENGATSDLIIPAVKKLLERSNLTIDEIDCLIVATVTPDYQFPATAAVVLNKLKSRTTFGFDIAAACAGFIYAISIASAFIETGKYKRVMVCGADKMSSAINIRDYKTSVLFGDGAGVVLIEEALPNNSRIHQCICKLDASGVHDVLVPHGGTANAIDYISLDAGMNKMQMKGKDVFARGVEAMVKIVSDFLENNDVRISYIIPHQANKRMLTKVSEALNLRNARMLMNIEQTGNTSAASIPICMSEFVKNGTIKRGDNILLCGFGAGYAYGLTYLTW